MERAIIKVLYGKYSDLTYENGKYYHIELLESEYVTTGSSEGSYEVFGDINAYAEYVGLSRIDQLTNRGRHPIFSIDLMSENRRSKIDKIIGDEL